MGTKGGGQLLCTNIDHQRKKRNRKMDRCSLFAVAIFFFLGGGEVRITIDYYMCRERKGSSVLVLLKIYLIGDQVFF